MTDILSRLRGEIPHRVIEDHWTVDFEALDAEREEAANEIEVLTRCFAIAAGYISATPGYTHKHPQQVADMIRNAVITGDENDD